MKLVPNAKKIARRSYSMWALYLALPTYLAGDLIYVTTGIDTNPRLWVVLSLAAWVGGVVGRFIPQGIDHA